MTLAQLTDVLDVKKERDDVNGIMATLRYGTPDRPAIKKRYSKCKNQLSEIVKQQIHLTNALIHFQHCVTEYKAAKIDLFTQIYLA
jgi:hypothetical protein